MNWNNVITVFDNLTEKQKFHFFCEAVQYLEEQEVVKYDTDNEDYYWTFTGERFKK